MPDSRPRGARSPWAVLAVLCLGLFMILLDGTIVNIAIPHIQTYFATSFSNIEWVMNAYILVFAVLLVTLGRFGDLWGRRRLFIGGMVLFTLGSLACGLAPSIYALIAFRVRQGIGGAALMPSTMSIIEAVFPAGTRGAQSRSASAAVGAEVRISSASGQPHSRSQRRPRRREQPATAWARVPQVPALRPVVL